MCSWLLCSLSISVHVFMGYCSISVHVFMAIMFFVNQCTCVHGYHVFCQSVYMCSWLLCSLSISVHVFMGYCSISVHVFMAIMFFVNQCTCVHGLLFNQCTCVHGYCVSSVSQKHCKQQVENLTQQLVHKTQQLTGLETDNSQLQSRVKKLEGYRNKHKLISVF